MSDFNQLTIIARICNEPELSVTPHDHKYCKMRLACNYNIHMLDGKKVQETLFIDATAWDKPAESIVTYLTKGARALFTGILKQENYQDKSGNARSKVSLGVQRVVFLDAKKNVQTGVQTKQTDQDTEELGPCDISPEQ